MPRQAQQQSLHAEASTAAEVSQQKTPELPAVLPELPPPLELRASPELTLAEALERFRTEQAATTEELTRLRAEQEVMMTKAEEITRLRAEQEVMAREHERLRAEYATVQQVRMIETHQLTEAIRWMRFLSYVTSMSFVRPLYLAFLFSL